MYSQPEAPAGCKPGLRVGDLRAAKPKATADAMAEMQPVDNGDDVVDGEFKPDVLKSVTQ